MQRLIYIFTIIFALATSAWAEDVVFQASAPRQVVADHPFQISYTINQRAHDLRAPEMPDFDVVAGPFTSQSSSHEYINGHMTSNYTTRYTLTLIASKTGTFAIQPATVMVDGQQYRSNGLKITVLPDDDTAGQGAAMNAQPAGSQGESAARADHSGKSGADVFVRTILSRTSVHEQESLLLTYKLYYTGVEAIQFTDINIPDFKGFFKQDIDLGDVQSELENYNGRNYQTAVLYQTLLYPQRAGDLVIESSSYDAILRVPNRAQVRSIFNITTFTNVSRTLRTNATTIHVSPLPSGKPKGFSGGVGKFQVSSTITGTELQNNDAVTIRLEVSGTGNMKMIDAPAIEWPDGFEVYDAKISNNFRTTPSGVSGTKQFEYLAIVRAAGDYTIPAQSFSFFNTETRQYETLQTREYHLHVERGSSDAAPTVSGGSYVEKEDIRELGSDIRYITTSAPKHFRAEESLFASNWWWLMYLLPALLSAVLFAIFRKQIRENSDLNRQRYKKANRVAQKRLKQAKACLQSGNTAVFYEEIERAAWSYLSDRLSIPTSDLTKDNIADILLSKAVPEDLIGQVTLLLTTAEMARYAPSAESDREHLLSLATTIIDQLEEQKI